VAFNLETGEEVWRSAGLRISHVVCANTAQVQVDGEVVIISPGGCVVRARDGKVLLRDLGWSGYGNAAGVLEDPDGSGDAYVVFNMGCRRTAFKSGHHIRAYRLSRKGENYSAEKLWEYGAEGRLGMTASSPVIVPRSGDIPAKVFLGGLQGYVFDLLKGTTLIAPKAEHFKEWHGWYEEALAERRKDESGNKKGMGDIIFARHKKWERARRGFIPAELRTGRYLNPIVVGDHLLTTDVFGTVNVVSTKLKRVPPTRDGYPEWDITVVSKNYLEANPKGRRPEMAKWTIATPQVWEDCLYIRQNGWLWCIGESKKKENRE
jgi:hypothetical protein